MASLHTAISRHILESRYHDISRMAFRGGRIAFLMAKIAFSTFDGHQLLPSMTLMNEVITHRTEMEREKEMCSLFKLFLAMGDEESQTII